MRIAAEGVMIQNSTFAIPQAQPETGPSFRCRPPAGIRLIADRLLLNSYFKERTQ